VLVSDIAMPGEDGYTLMRGLRTRGGDVGRIPAVALTAFAGSQDRDRALAAGYQLHLSKPIEPDALVDAVARLGGGRTPP
jgi:CheY-like chemotaxis protein